MASMTRGLYPVQTFSIRRAEGSARLLGAWEVIDSDGHWIGYRPTYCAAANWVREVEGLIEAHDLPDWVDVVDDLAPRESDLEADWMSEEEWAWWSETCRAVEAAEDRWAWLDDVCRSTEAVEQDEDDARTMRGDNPGHPFGPDFDRTTWLSEGH